MVSKLSPVKFATALLMVPCGSSSQMVDTVTLNSSVVLASAGVYDTLPALAPDVIVQADLNPENLHRATHSSQWGQFV